MKILTLLSLLSFAEIPLCEKTFTSSFKKLLKVIPQRIVSCERTFFAPYRKQ